jgi:hypothetical protein
MKRMAKPETQLSSLSGERDKYIKTGLNAPRQEQVGLKCFFRREISAMTFVRFSGKNKVFKEGNRKTDYHY